ncbi:MAG: tetratricopeptide repeat protein, partial [Cyanobacteria bacterium REEB67]|nr:tetratricopeptide repeat protein [Cyanobacteria bacterium REEB67]
YFLSHHEDLKAIDAFSKAMRLDNMLLEDCYFHRAWAYTNLEQYNKALADCNALLKMDPESEWPLHLRAWVYGRQKDYKRQLEDCTTLIRLDPKSPHAYRERASVYDSLKQYQLATNDRRIARQLTDSKSSH